MISLRQQLPLIRLGQDEIVHYEESWLAEVIRDAAQKAGHGDCWFADDIAHGVLIYLKERFPQTTIDVNELFRKLGKTLSAVGYQDVAGNLKPSAPPLRVSLDRLALDAGDGYELFFFQLLSERLASVKNTGTRHLHCTEMRDAVARLCRAKKWSRKCDKLRQEILNFVVQELERNDLLRKRELSLIVT